MVQAYYWNCIQIIRFAGIFYKLRDIIPRSVLKTIYFSMIYPHMLYGIELYDNTCMTYMEPLIKANNKLLRIIQNKHSRSHVNDLYLNCNCLPIPLLFKFQNYKFLHRFNHFRSSLPFIYQNYFTFNTFFHHHFTRRQLTCINLLLPLHLESGRSTSLVWHYGMNLVLN